MIERTGSGRFQLRLVARIECLHRSLRPRRVHRALLLHLLLVAMGVIACSLLALLAGMLRGESGGGRGQVRVNQAVFARQGRGGGDGGQSSGSGR